MRDIKFRSWDTTRNEWIKWFFIDADDGSITENCVNDLLYGDNYILEQYTGLHDKNGKEIYEGDIVAGNPRFSYVPCHGKHDNAEIVRMKEIYGSDDMGIDCIGYPLYWCDFEVIGNIHENPEILNED